MPANVVDPKAALDAERAALHAMPPDKVKEPPYPPPHLVAEANALYLVADRHRKSLNAVGVDDALIDALPRRAQALAGAQAARALVPETERSAQELETEEAAYEVRNELYAAGRFATRDDDLAQSSLDRVSEGAGLDDLVQDLKDLHAFAGKYESELVAIKIDVDTLTKRALALAGEFEQQLAHRRAATDAERAATDLRNRAATHLYEAMAEIRAAGVFAFRNDPNVLPLFRSAYRRRHRGGSGSGTPATG